MLTKIILQEYFHCLALFNYDKAKIIIETCNPNWKNDPKSNLSKICDCFLSFLNLERKYYKLVFLNNRRKSIFSRKERPLEGYQELFERTTAVVCERINDELGRQCLLLLCSVRSHMTEMYQNISLMSRNGVKCIGDVVGSVKPLRTCLTEVLSSNEENVVEIISSLISVVELEVDILLNLGEAQILMSNLYFLVPINLLYAADEKYQRFLQLTSSLTTSTSIFSRPIASFPLLNWISKFYVGSLAKYTLYFHSVLMRQKQTLFSPNDFLVENASLDLLNRVSSFVKRTSSSNLLLIFDAAKQNVPFLGHGYVLPFSRGEKVSGLQSFPVIFSWPLEAEISKQLLCNLVTLVLKIIHSSDTADIIKHVIEPDNCKTYFLSQVEERMYLAIVFEGRREKDKVVINFMEEFRNCLTGKIIIDELSSASL